MIYFFRVSFDLTMERDILLTKLGARVRELREAGNITQTQLAHAIGKDQQSVQRLEAGRVNPSILYLQEIAKGLNLTLEHLVRNL